MKHYLIINKLPKDGEAYFMEFESMSDAKHWIINHLDLSKKWIVGACKTEGEAC